MVMLCKFCAENGLFGGILKSEVIFFISISVRITFEPDITLFPKAANALFILFF